MLKTNLAKLVNVLQDNNTATSGFGLVWLDLVSTRIPVHL